VRKIRFNQNEKRTEDRINRKDRKREGIQEPLQGSRLLDPLP